MDPSPPTEFVSKATKQEVRPSPTLLYVDTKLASFLCIIVDVFAPCLLLLVHVPSVICHFLLSDIKL